MLTVNLVMKSHSFVRSFIYSFTYSTNNFYLKILLPKFYVPTHEDESMHFLYILFIYLHFYCKLSLSWLWQRIIFAFIMYEKQNILNDEIFKYSWKQVRWHVHKEVWEDGVEALVAPLPSQLTVQTWHIDI